MSEIPNTSDSGALTCSRCDTVLETKKAPFHLHDEYVGHFESLVCPICNYHVLTENGYDKAITEAMKFGLVGPAEVKEMDDTVEEQLSFTPRLVGVNLQMINFIIKANEKNLITAYNNLSDIELQQKSMHKQSKLLLTIED